MEMALQREPQVFGKEFQQRGLSGIAGRTCTLQRIDLGGINILKYTFHILFGKSTTNAYIYIRHSNLYSPLKKIKLPLTTLGVMLKCNSVDLTRFRGLKMQFCLVPAFYIRWGGQFLLRNCIIVGLLP